MDNEKLKKFIKCTLETIAVDIAILLFFLRINPVLEEFFSLNMHPFVMVSAAAALRYGNYLGVISASVTSIIFIYTYSFLGRDMYLFFVDFENYKFLIMFFLTAVVLGRFKDNYTYNMEMSSEKHRLLNEKYKDLEQLYDKNRFINKELKKQIVDSENSIISLYEIATSLDSLDPEEIYTQTMGIMARFLGARTVSIYIVNENRDFLRLKLRMGEGTGLANSIDIKNMPCVKRIIDEKQTVKYGDSMSCINNSAIMGAPIVYEGKTIALINLEDVEFERVTDYSYYLFKLITEWINKALAQAISIEGHINSHKYYEDTRIMKYNEFKERLEEEKKRKIRFGLEYGLLKFSSLGQGIQSTDKSLSRLIRDVDVVGYDESNGEVYLLLPATPQKVTHIVEERLKGELEIELERLA